MSRPVSQAEARRSPLHKQRNLQTSLISQNHTLADTCMQTQSTLLWATHPLSAGNKISHAQLPGSQALPTLIHRDTLVHRHTS